MHSTARCQACEALRSPAHIASGQEASERGTALAAAATALRSRCPPREWNSSELPTADVAPFPVRRHSQHVGNLTAPRMAAQLLAAMELRGECLASPASAVAAYSRHDSELLA